jgi:hypothetical protein
MKFEFDEGDEVVIIDLEGRRFFGEIITYDPEEDTYWVMVDGFGDAAIGVPGDSDRLFPYIEADLDDEDEELETPSFGMSSEALAEHTEKVVKRVMGRIRGVGDEQYSEGDHQKFESMSIEELMEWSLEEIEDTIAYGVFQHIRFNRILGAVRDRL